MPQGWPTGLPTNYRLCGKPELSFWMDKGRMQVTPEGARGGFMNVRRAFNDYPPELLKQFVPGADIAPGLSTITAFGHTPGHSAIQVTAGPQRFTFIGDMTNVPTLFVTLPDWHV